MAQSVINVRQTGRVIAQFNFKWCKFVVRL